MGVPMENKTVSVAASPDFAALDEIGITTPVVLLMPYEVEHGDPGLSVKIMGGKYCTFAHKRGLVNLIPGIGSQVNLIPLAVHRLFMMRCGTHELGARPEPARLG